MAASKINLFYQIKYHECPNQITSSILSIVIKITTTKGKIKA